MGTNIKEMMGEMIGGVVNSVITFCLLLQPLYFFLPAIIPVERYPYWLKDCFGDSALRVIFIALPLLLLGLRNTLLRKAAAASLTGLWNFLLAFLASLINTYHVQSSHGPSIEKLALFWMYFMGWCFVWAGILFLIHITIWTIRKLIR